MICRSFPTVGDQHGHGPLVQRKDDKEHIPASTGCFQVSKQINVNGASLVTVLVNRSDARSTHGAGTKAQSPYRAIVLLRWNALTCTLLLIAATCQGQQLSNETNKQLCAIPPLVESTVRLEWTPLCSDDSVFIIMKDARHGKRPHPVHTPTAIASLLQPVHSAPTSLIVVEPVDNSVLPVLFRWPP
jgi:hypothetical protein